MGKTPRQGNTTLGIPESRFETLVVWFRTMQKVERMGFKNQTHTEDATVTLLENLDIHRYDSLW